MKNMTEEHGNFVAIIINHKGNEYRTLVDKGDFEKVSSIRGTWHLNSRGYVSTTISGKRVSMHRLLLDPPDDKLVDHIDGDPLNNRKDNLRIVDNKGNQQNIRNLPKPSRSGFRGVRDNNGRWGKKYRAFVIVDKKERSLGSFDDIEEANAAAIIGRALYHPHSKEAALLEKLMQKKMDEN